MCIPCAAPALPGLGWILLILVGALLVGLWRLLPYAGVALTGAALIAYRWFTGSRVIKDLNETDEQVWDKVRAKGHKGPLVTRPVRAVTRTVATITTVALLTGVPFAIPAAVLVTLALGAGGVNAYRIREKAITAQPLTGPTRRQVRR